MPDIECVPVPPLMPSSTDWLMTWTREHRRLVEYLALAEQRIRHGKVTINLCDGKIVSYEVYQREREEIEG